ncbi:MAG: nitrite reductase small subunit NirD [Solirubrobacteraceae bacterium]
MTDTPPVGPTKMTKVCGVQDVPMGEGRAVTIGGRRIALFRTRGGWYALDDACPHLGGPLADGIVAERSVICPLHDRRFDLASGAALSSDCGAAKAHRVTLVADEVFLTLDAAQEEDSTQEEDSALSA